MRPVSGADDDEVPLLPAHRDGVKRREAGRDAGESRGLLGALDAVERPVECVPYLHVAAAHVALNGVVHLGLRLVDEFVHIIGLVKGFLEDSVSGLDEVTLDGLLLEDPDVVLHVGCRAHAGCQGGKLRRPANLFQDTVLPKPFCDRRKVHRRSALEEFPDCPEDEPELGVEKALLAERLYGPVHAFAFHHHRSDDGLFHLGCMWGLVPHLGRCRDDGIMRLPLVDVFSCHGSFRFVSVQIYLVPQQNNGGVENYLISL